MAVNSPIKEIEVINQIKDLFKQREHNRGYLLFTLSINTGINLKDLLELNVKDVKNKQYLAIGEGHIVPLSEELQASISEYINGRRLEEPLFKNKSGERLDRTSVFYIFKMICTELGLQNKYSVVSWRKTFAYHYYKKYKDLSYLQWLFNQSRIEDALRFIEVEENMNLRFREGVGL